VYLPYNDYGYYPGSVADKFNGLKIYYTAAAVQPTEARNFPYSKHRSKRIFKKLIKRYGSEFVMEACILQAGGAIYAHPSMKRRIEDAVRQKL
jgi:nucleoside diphosphate kinase